MPTRKKYPEGPVTQHTTAPAAQAMLRTSKTTAVLNVHVPRVLLVMTAFLLPSFIFCNAPMAS